MRKFVSICLALVFAGSLTGCMEDGAAELPPPDVLTQEAIGYYCNMTVQDHRGPKGQIKLKGESKPLWFSSVRDTITFTRLPGESKNIMAIYVTDMSDDASWDNPENSKWIEARSAHFVSGSSRSGGMGASEQVPFATKEDAHKFTQRYGGHILAYSDIPDSAIFGPVEISADPENKDLRK